MYIREMSRLTYSGTVEQTDRRMVGRCVKGGGRGVEERWWCHGGGGRGGG